MEKKAYEVEIAFGNGDRYGHLIMTSPQTAQAIGNLFDLINSILPDEAKYPCLYLNDSDDFDIWEI